MNPEISIIIPALNEEDSIRETLSALENFENAEIIVVDGGSTDATVSIAEGFRGKILHAPRGRGRQLEVGGNAAKGAVLWFLHADTVVSPGCVGQIKLALKDARVA